jgi:hypothetical protein
MFKIEKTPKFTREVTVLTPIDDGHREDTFKARFIVHPSHVVEEFDLRGAGQGVRDFLDIAIDHLADIVGEDNEPIPYDDALKDAVLSNYAARLALVNTYMTAIAKAKAGN